MCSSDLQTLATITLQNFFKLYRKLCGMTGTAMTEAGEFWKIYALDVVAVPTNRPMRRDELRTTVILAILVLIIVRSQKSLI